MTANSHYERITLRAKALRVSLLGRPRLLKSAPRCGSKVQSCGYFLKHRVCRYTAYVSCISLQRVIFHAFSEGRIVLELRFGDRDVSRERHRATTRVLYTISDAPSLHAPRAGTRLTVYRAHQVTRRAFRPRVIRPYGGISRRLAHIFR